MMVWPVWRWIWTKKKWWTEKEGWKINPQNTVHVSLSVYLSIYLSHRAGGGGIGP